MKSKTRYKVSVNYTAPDKILKTPAIYVQEEKMITAKKKEEWLLHLELWKESGLSASKYCIENDLNKNSFRYWIDRDRGKIKIQKGRMPEKQTCLRPVDKFVKLDLQKSLPTKTSKSISFKDASYEIKIPTAFKKQDLENLLEVLESGITCL